MAKAGAPALFDLGELRPTTRDIAALVKHGGVAALPDAVQRADHATYQEIRCRSALNRVDGMPFRWTLNPYRGCTHGCHYCFARRYQHQLELGEGDDFASVIFVKTNFVEVLRRELARPSWSREQAALGTATDPYQPIEGRYQLTRGALEACRDAATPVGIVTKGPMVVRDVDVLQALTARAECEVYMSVPSIDEDAWRRLEPGTAPPLQRLRAVRALTDAGIHCGVLMAPLVPGITTRASVVEATLKAAADHGARSVGAMVLHLEGGTRSHFLRILGQEYPHLVAGYERLFVGKYATASYTDEVQRMVGLLKAKYGMANRRRGEAVDTATPPAEPTRQLPMRFVRARTERSRPPGSPPEPPRSDRG
jgi:DNA repair photolyase